MSTSNHSLLIKTELERKDAMRWSWHVTLINIYTYWIYEITLDLKRMEHLNIKLIKFYQGT
jgi:hypothetical protein